MGWLRNKDWKYQLGCKSIFIAYPAVLIHYGEFR